MKNLNVYEKATRLKKVILVGGMVFTMAFGMSGCGNQTEDSLETFTEQETMLGENEDVSEANSTKYYSAKDIYVVTATTLNGDKVTYLATKYNTLGKTYYLELKTGCVIQTRINKVTELVRYLEVEELKETYSEPEIIELYSQITSSNTIKLDYPASRYANCPVEISEEEEYKAAYFHFLVAKDNEGEEELYLVRHKTIISTDVYEFFTDTHLKSYQFIVPLSKFAPLCDYIPLTDRKEYYTSEELKMILDYARRVFHGNRDFNLNNSMGLYNLGQKYSEEQVLVLDTSKLMNFGVVEDSKKVHILLLTDVNEDKTVFNYSELGSSNDVANLIISENQYTLGYCEQENGVAYIVNSELDEDAILPLNEFLIKNGYEDSVQIQAFTIDELQTLEQTLQGNKVFTLSAE